MRGVLRHGLHGHSEHIGNRLIADLARGASTHRDRPANARQMLSLAANLALNIPGRFAITTFVTGSAAVRRP